MTFLGVDSDLRIIAIRQNRSVLSQKYYMKNALFALFEPYDLAPSIFGRIVLHIAPIIPLVFLIKMIGNKKSNYK